MLKNTCQVVSIITLLCLVQMWWKSVEWPSLRSPASRIDRHTFSKNPFLELKGSHNGYFHKNSKIYLFTITLLSPYLSSYVRKQKVRVS